jgi:hypothetical protein
MRIYVEPTAIQLLKTQGCFYSHPIKFQGCFYSHPIKFQGCLGALGQKVLCT